MADPQQETIEELNAMTTAILELDRKIAAHTEKVRDEQYDLVGQWFGKLLWDALESDSGTPEMLEELRDQISRLIDRKREGS